MRHLPHLSDEERSELLDILEQSFGAVLRPELERLELKACPWCVARVVAVALGNTSAWYAAYSAHGQVERDQLVRYFVDYFEAQLRHQLDAFDGSDAPTRTPRGVH